MSEVSRCPSFARLVGPFLLFVAGAIAPGCGHPQNAATTSATSTLTSAAPTTTGDPLPSWNDGAVKRGIIEFVTRVTTAGTDFVPVEDRIAALDNDGTLWQERPRAEAAFVVARLSKMAEADPSLRQRQPYKAALEHDMSKLHATGRHSLFQLVAVTHSGMDNDAFKAEARQFLASAVHPRWRVPYTSLTYTPMTELIGYLRKSGFTSYICSGGDVDFMRTFTMTSYAIPPERVIGSELAKELVTKDGRAVLLRKPKIETVNDKAQKPVDLDRQIGKRPIFAAGNVGNAGDIGMLTYTRDRRGPSFALVIDHDDDVREFAYGEPDDATLTAAREHGFAVVSMKRDWRTIFPAADETP